MQVLAVIPARYKSTRFPGKPLIDLGGKTMIRRIFETVSAIEGIDDVVVATDDPRIAMEVIGFDGKLVMTSSSCASGTDRVAQAIGSNKAELIVNVQGDQVIMDAAAVTALAEALKAGCDMVTIAAKATDEELANPNCVKVVCDAAGDAITFSRSVETCQAKAPGAECFKHVGVYGFKREVLERFAKLPQSPLEKAESLEQLRALENGIPIRVILASGEFHEINAPEDQQRLEGFWQD